MRAEAKSGATEQRWAWLRHPELWVAVGLGAFLRLVWLDHAMWLADQNNLLDLARTAWARGLVPVTGIPASILVLNHPLSIYTLMPLAAFTADPWPQTVALALWNILGVGLAYLSALRGFGRRVATVTALLFASNTATVQYSRFVWQQNYIAPLLALWLLALVVGVRQGSRGWLAAATALGLAAAALHPTALSLIPVLIVAALLAPARLSRGELASTAGIAALVAAPTVAWEVASKGYDFTALRAYLKLPNHFNLDVIANMPLAFGDALGTDALGSTTAAAHWKWLGQGLGLIVTALFLIGLGVLLTRVVCDVRRAMLATSDSLAKRIWDGVLASRQDARWRVELLLTLAALLPILSMLSHRSPIYPHYLIVEYPVAFLVIALLARDIVAWAQGPHPLTPSLLTWRGGIKPRGLMWGTVIALVLAGSVDSLLYFGSIEGPGFRPGAGWGYAVGQAARARAALDTISQRERIGQIEVLARLEGGRLDLARQLTTADPQRSVLDPGCLLLPAPGTQDRLVVTENDVDPIVLVLSTSSWARLVATIPMQGADPLRVYRVRSGSLLSVPLSEPHLSSPQSPLSFQRIGEVTGSNGTLIVAWAVTGSVTNSGPYGPRRWLRFTAGSTTLTCAPRVWQSGETLLMVQAPVDSTRVGSGEVSTGIEDPLTVGLGGVTGLSALPGPTHEVELIAHL